jgi:hypothetical protein
MAVIRASIKRAILRELGIPSYEPPKRRRSFTKGGHMSSGATVDDLPPLPAAMTRPPATEEQP